MFWYAYFILFYFVIIVIFKLYNKSKNQRIVINLIIIQIHQRIVIKIQYGLGNGFNRQKIKQ